MKCKDLSEVRRNIDRIDDEIIKLIGERHKYVKEAARFKSSENSVRAPKRVEEVIKGVREKASIYETDGDMIEAVYREMITRFINTEMNDFKLRKDK